MNVTGIDSFFVKGFTGWDNVGDGDCQYYNAVLAVDIGCYKAGTTVPTIAIIVNDTDKPVVQIYSEDGKSYDEFDVVPMFTIGPCVRKDN